MEQIDEQVWDVLTTDEQTAITLSLSYGKSSWEVGEIMGKSHYKYLEICARAQRFFKLFSEYFTKHEQLFPEGLIVDPSFQEYMEKAILKRLPIKTIITSMEEKEYKEFRKRNKEITEKMKVINKQKLGRDLYNLILEFDRWNNHRILSPELQEPSAFKRRNKTKEKNRIKLIAELPEVSVQLIMEKYKYKAKGKKYFLPLVTPIFQLGFVIIPIKADYATTAAITEMGFPFFKKKEVAKEFIIKVQDYTRPKWDEFKISGIKFWPEYRVLLKKAVNYNKLENKKPHRDFYEPPFNDTDEQIVRKRKKRVKPPETTHKPSDSESFW